jgi:hypothetical protein
VQYMYLHGEASVKESDLKKLNSNSLEKARDSADYIMNCLRSHALEACGEELNGKATQLVGMMDVNMVAATLGLKNMLHKNTNVVAHKFLLDLAELTGDEPILEYEQAALKADADFFKKDDATTHAAAADSSIGMSLMLSLFARSSRFRLCCIFTCFGSCVD